MLTSSSPARRPAGNLKFNSKPGPFHLFSERKTLFSSRKFFVRDKETRPAATTLTWTLMTRLNFHLDLKILIIMELFVRSCALLTEWRRLSRPHGPTARRGNSWITRPLSRSPNSAAMTGSALSQSCRIHDNATDERMGERADRADCYNWVAFTGFDLDLELYRRGI